MSTSWNGTNITILTLIICGEVAFCFLMELIVRVRSLCEWCDCRQLDRDTHTCTHTHTHTYIYIHTYIHTHIYHSVYTFCGPCPETRLFMTEAAYHAHSTSFIQIWDSCCKSSLWMVVSLQVSSSPLVPTLDPPHLHNSSVMLATKLLRTKWRCCLHMMKCLACRPSCLGYRSGLYRTQTNTGTTISSFVSLTPTEDVISVVGCSCAKQLPDSGQPTNDQTPSASVQARYKKHSYQNWSKLATVVASASTGSNIATHYHTRLEVRCFKV